MAGNRFMLVMFGLAAVAWSQPAPADPGRVEGTVTNAITKQPMANVRVFLSSHKRYGAITDGEGRFVLPAVPWDSYMLSSSAPGFIVDPGSTLSDEVMVRPGAKVSGIDVTLTPEAVISGRVLDSRGDPMEYLTIEVGKPGQSYIVGTGTTDDRGRFRIGGLVAGSYWVRAAPSLWDIPLEIRTDGTTEVEYQPTYYPSAVKEEEISLVEVHAGAEASAEIRLVPMPILRVSGTVGGVPEGADDAVVIFHNSLGTQHVTPIRNGRFSLWRLPPGKYFADVIYKGPDDRKSAAVTGAIELVKDNIDNLHFDLIPQFDLSGRVEWDGAPPITLPQPLSIHLFVADEALLAGSDSDGSVESDGLIFRIPGAVVGRYWVKAEDARGENVWVKAIRVDSHEAPDRILDLRGPPANLTLLLSTRAAQISGTVEDDKGPVEGAEVQLVSENKDGQRPHSAHTDLKGAYSFPAVPPGKYTISAWMPSRRDNLQAAEEIEASEGDRITKNLKVRR